MATKTIKYKITFLSDWHAGSGLGSGANADAVVIKDKHNLPYLPGKTIKGLLKDALHDIMDVQPDSIKKEMVDKLFGCEIKKKKEENIEEVEDFKTKSTVQGQLFFSNAEIVDIEKMEISEEMIPFLYRNLASTTIGENGVAKEGSLRSMEVCVPLELNGQIVHTEDFKPEERALLEKAIKWTRGLGSNRNRGLGRCQIQIID
jgi:CRISPR/Cas system CSM-associated protein Csm3 (group 7 of RAMP superfamily)